MHCVLCREAYFGQEKCVPFVEGTNNFKISVIQKHEKTSAHQSLVNKTEAERKAAVKAGKCKKKSFEERESRPRFEHLFRTVYKIQKEKLSFSQFPILINQQIQNGVPLEGRYTNHHHVVPDFSRYIAMSMINDLVADIHQSRHFGIILDDVSHLVGASRDAVFITYLKDCHRQTKYLGLVDNDTGVGIAFSLVEMLAKLGLPSPFEKLLCLTTDGQPVHRTSEQEGLCKALEKEAPVLLSMHCLVHKMEHSVKPILFEHPPVKRCVDILYKLFCFLRDLQKKTGQTMHIWTPVSAIDHVTYSSNPKWLVFNLKFLLAILEKWGSVTVFLTDTYHNLDRKMRLEAAEILTNLKNSTFLAYLHLLKEVFQVLQNFREKVTDTPLACYMVLQELRNTAATILDQILIGSSLSPVIQELEEMTGFFHGMPVTQDFNPQSFKVGAKELCHSVSLQISAMANESSTSLCKFSVLDPKNWPLDSEILLGAYGIDTIKELFIEMQLLLPQMCLANVIQEWCSYKSFVKTSLSKSIGAGFDNFAAIVVSRYSDLYPSICTFLTAATLLSPSCWVTQQGFQELCLIKESRKNVLTDDTLWQTMVINVNGAPLEQWDPEPVVDLWLKTRFRRPNNRTKATPEGTNLTARGHINSDGSGCAFHNYQLLVITGELCDEPMNSQDAE